MKPCLIPLSATAPCTERGRPFTVTCPLRVLRIALCQGPPDYKNPSALAHLRSRSLIQLFTATSFRPPFISHFRITRHTMKLPWFRLIALTLCVISVVSASPLISRGYCSPNFEGADLIVTNSAYPAWTTPEHAYRFEFTGQWPDTYLIKCAALAFPCSTLL